MELHISENDNYNYEQIPENIPPKMRVIKKTVQFEQPVNQMPVNQMPVNQTIKPMVSGVKARMVRPNVPPPKPKISYDDILNKMGMFVSEGKLHLLDGQQTIPKTQKSLVQKEPVQNPVENSYIYNKYFQGNNYGGQEQSQRPLTPLEYRDMLIKDIIQKHRIKQMKSTKLVMPNSNINFASGPTSNMNKLFGFSQR
jgi:hypothetical protein